MRVKRGGQTIQYNRFLYNNYPSSLHQFRYLVNHTKDSHNEYTFLYEYLFEKQKKNKKYFFIQCRYFSFKVVVHHTLFANNRVGIGSLFAKTTLLLTSSLH